MKSWGTALVMTAVLFLYGYLLSTAGHDHKSHSESEKHHATSADHESAVHSHH